MRRKTTKSSGRNLARECAQVAKEMHEKGSQCVHLRDVSLKIFGKYGHVKSGAYKDILKVRSKIRDLLENPMKCHTALAIQKYEDDGYPVVTDIDHAKTYLPITAGRNKGGVILVFASLQCAIYDAFVHVNKQLGDQKSVKGDARLCGAHHDGVMSDESVIDIKCRSNTALESGRLPQIERTVNCRKCKREVTYSAALKERWFFMKLLDRWSCRTCHLKTMRVVDAEQNRKIPGGVMRTLD